MNSSLHSLETDIAGWRRRLISDGVDAPEVLDELESHLCAEIDERLRSGASVQEAFAEAVQRIGEGRMLKDEFKKANETMEAKTIKRILIGIGIAGILFATGIILPALARLKQLGVVPQPGLALLVGGIILGLIIGGTISCSLRRTA